MKSKKLRTPYILGAILAAIIILIYLSQIQQGSEQVVICLQSDQSCKLFKASQISAQYSNGNPNCIKHPDVGNICRPDFVMYKLSQLVPEIRKKCETVKHGTFSSWDTCTASDGIWKFDPLGPGWKRN